MKKILLVGGGTGGHVFPLLNLVQDLNKVQSSKFKVQNDEFVIYPPEKGGEGVVKNHDDEQIQFHWIGESRSIESKVTTEEQIPFSPIICGKLRRYFSFQTMLLPFQVLIGIIQSARIILREKPKAIFSKGGYVSLPVAIAGWMLRIPVYFHESDSIPGLANRIVAKFATGIFTSFSEADSFFEEKKILGHGSLLSPEIASISGEIISQNPRTQILVSCGSQGSATIFDAVLDLLPGAQDIDFHIILGVKNLDYRAKFEQFPNVEIFDFFYNQSDYLRIVQKCDVVIARSGSSVFEFEALGLHMILIPHPFTGNNHQYWNAVAFQKKGHELLEQKDISKLKNVVEKYRTFKKSGEKRVVDRTIFDTITRNLLK